MSAPMKLQAHHLRNLAAALDQMTKIKQQSFVDFCAYGPIDVKVGGETVVRVSWNSEHDEYEVDDRNGS